MHQILNSIKKQWKLAVIILILIVIGTYARIANLWNVGSFFDLVVTQYDWGKVHYEIGPYRFWQEYDKTLDYMPGAMYIDWGIYWISSFFGGSDQAFVTTMKLFNWIVDILFAVLVYRFASLNKSFTKGFRVFLAAIAYSLPSIWSVTGLWGQMDTLVASFGIITLLFYFYANKKPDYFVLGNFWLKLHPYFALISGIFLAFGYWTKPTGVLILPVLAMLLLHRLDWKGLLQMFVGFIITSIPFAIVPILANPYKLFYIMTLPLFGFGVNSATRDASNFWLLIDMPWYVGETILNLGFIKLTIYHFALIISATWIGIFLLKYFGLLPVQKKSKTKTLNSGFMTSFRHGLSMIRPWINNVLDKFFEKNITLFDVTLITTIVSYVYFLFYIKMLSRYLMMGILMSLLLLALWDKSKKFWWIFSFIVITHFCFALNQIFIVNNNIAWVDFFNKNVMPFNYLSLIAAIYLISWIVISLIFWQQLDEK